MAQGREVGYSGKPDSEAIVEGLGVEQRCASAHGDGPKGKCEAGPRGPEPDKRRYSKSQVSATTMSNHKTRYQYKRIGPISICETENGAQRQGFGHEVLIIKQPRWRSALPDSIEPKCLCHCQGRTHAKAQGRPAGKAPKGGGLASKAKGEAP